MLSDKPAVTAVKGDAASVWALSANDMLDDDVDLIDSDELLDDADLKKPDPASLRGMYCDWVKALARCRNR